MSHKCSNCVGEQLCKYCSCLSKFEKDFTKIKQENIQIKENNKKYLTIFQEIKELFSLEFNKVINDIRIILGEIQKPDSLIRIVRKALLRNVYHSI